MTINITKLLKVYIWTTQLIILTYFFVHEHAFHPPEPYLPHNITSPLTTNCYFHSAWLLDNKAIYWEFYCIVCMTIHYPSVRIVFQNGSLLARFDRYKAVRVLKSNRQLLRVVLLNCGQWNRVWSQCRNILSFILVYGAYRSFGNNFYGIHSVSAFERVRW